MFKRILVATDGKDGLDRLGSCLSSLQRGGAEQVAFVRTFLPKDDGVGIPSDPSVELRAAETHLRSRLEPTPEGLSIAVQIQVGKPVEVICQAIDSFGSDVLILGTALKDFLAEKIFGSTTMDLIPKLDIPVLVMRPQLVQAMTLEELELRCSHLFGHLLVPYDFQEFSQELLHRLSLIVQSDQGQHCQTISLLYVVDSGSRAAQSSKPEDMLQEAHSALTRIQAELKTALPWIECHTWVRMGSPITEILQVAAEANVTAITSGSRRTGRLLEWSIPSVTGELLRRSWHSVLYFPL